DRHPIGGMRVGIEFGRRAMGGPAGMADADMSVQRLHAQLGRQIAQLALGPSAHDGAAFQRGHAGAVIPAVFQALQRVDKTTRDRLITDNSYDPAHAISPWLPDLQPSWPAPVP